VETLENRGNTCEIVDALGFISERTSKFVSWGHSFIYCHCPSVFSVGYGVTEKHPKMLGEGSMAYWLFGRGSEDLYNYCQEHCFDAVICTHVFAALMLTDMQRAYNYSIKSYFVATDYSTYPWAPACTMDAFFIPAESVAESFGDGVTVTTGIPVYQRFFQELDKTEAKKALNIAEYKKHILVMCGSMGCGPIEEITKRIVSGMTDSCVLSIICGTNERLYNRLSTAYQSNPNVIIHGFVRNVHEMMSAADIYVTKPGGISTTEAMAKGLPMVLVDAVAGCEDYNMHHFQEIGGAVASKEPKEIAELCLELLENDAQREQMRQNLLRNRKNSAVIICDYLQEHLS